VGARTHAPDELSGLNWLRLRIYRNTEAGTSNVFTGVLNFPVNIRFEKQQSFFCARVIRAWNSTDLFWETLTMAKAAAKKAPAKKAVKKPAKKAAKKK
jgi:hypothetical protein